MSSIVIYFSRSGENYFGGELKNIEKGNTEVIAEYIQELDGADLFKVEPAVEYPADYMECIDVATQLEQLDFAGKSVKPFVTHEGSGFGSSQKDLAKLCEGADIKNGLSIPGANVYDAKETVKSWIED